MQRHGMDITEKKNWEEANGIVTTINGRVCLLLRVSEKEHVSFFFILK